MSPAAPSPKDKFIRATIAFLASEKAEYYVRSDRVYIDTRGFNATKLMLLEGGEFKSFLMRYAKTTVNILLKGAEVDQIIEHVKYHAQEVAKPLAADARAAFIGEDLYINTGWEDGKMVKISQEGVWTEEKPVGRIFEPLPPKMRMAVPLMREATLFPALLKKGIADFGDMNCLLCVTCATLMLPADFVHPFIVFTGDQARGKSTTMKLLVQLIDPYDSSELMTVGEDMRDIIALVRGRHSIALDNVSKLPFDEDLLSKMYSGGMFSARKMMTNSEMSEVELPRLRVLMNGIGTAFNRSDLMSRCIFIEHPVLTTKENGRELFESLHMIERRWLQMRPELLGSLLRAIGAGLKLFRERERYENKKSEARFVEYAVLGECISEAMGFKPGLFTEQVKKAGEEMRSDAIESDDCAQLILAWLNGESSDTQIAGFEDEVRAGEAIKVRVITPTELFAEMKALAAKRGYSVYSMKWLASVKALSTAVARSKKNIDNGGWAMNKISSGAKKRCFEFTKKAA